MGGREGGARKEIDREAGWDENDVGAFERRQSFGSEVARPE